MDPKKETEINPEALATPEAKDTAEKQAPPEPDKRMREDISLLKELFPALTAEEIPDEVWEKVKDGESLAASYALYFIRSLKETERIEKVNSENEKKAVPRVKTDKASDVFYSPETVKAMSAAEVRKHYADILKSMDNWN